MYIYNFQFNKKKKTQVPHLKNIITNIIFLKVLILQVIFLSANTLFIQHKFSVLFFAKLI